MVRCSVRAGALPPDPSSTTLATDHSRRIPRFYPSDRAPTLRRGNRGRIRAHGPEPAVLTQQTRRQTASTGQAPDFSLTFFALEGGPMSQERPFGNSSAEHHPEPNHPQPTEGYGANHSPVPTPAHAFDNSPTGSPDGTPANGVASSPESRAPFETEPPQRQVVEARAASPTSAPAPSQSRSSDPVQTGPDFDSLSSDTTDSLREQVRQVHQKLDDVQKEVLKLRGEIGESSKGGSPFTPEIQGKPFPATFRLTTLEPYDGSGDPTEHIAAFPTQMALYDTFESLMCRAFPTTLRGSAGT
ncbi:hypothetical protein BHM03_00009619, partial [Ensete ventricosum]